jgi:hypothetical protein
VARLDGVSLTHDGGVLHLIFDGMPAGSRGEVWLQAPDGGHRTPGVDATGEALLPLPRGLAEGPPVYEMWCRTPRGTGRVRAGTHLATTRVAALPRAHGNHEVVIRLNRSGNVVLLVGPPVLHVVHAYPGEDSDTLVIVGTGAPSGIADELELHCPWTGDHHRAPVEPTTSGWLARVSLAKVASEGAERNRVWSIRVRNGAGGFRTPLVPVEARRNFPVSVPVGSETIHLLLGPVFAPLLSLVADEHGEKWPRLLRIQRSTPQHR